MFGCYKKNRSYGSVRCVMSTEEFNATDNPDEFGDYWELEGQLHPDRDGAEKALTRFVCHDVDPAKYPL